MCMILNQTQSPFFFSLQLHLCQTALHLFLVLSSHLVLVGALHLLFLVVALGLQMGAPSVVLSGNLASSVVAVEAVLGSRNVDMSVTQSLSIHGSRACRPAQVSF